MAAGMHRLNGMWAGRSVTGLTMTTSTSRARQLRQLKGEAQRRLTSLQRRVSETSPKHATALALLQRAAGRSS